MRLLGERQHLVGFPGRRRSPCHRPGRTRPRGPRRPTARRTCPRRLGDPLQRTGSVIRATCPSRTTSSPVFHVLVPVVTATAGSIDVLPLLLARRGPEVEPALVHTPTIGATWGRPSARTDVNQYSSAFASARSTSTHRAARRPGRCSGCRSGRQRASRSSGSDRTGDQNSSGQHGRADLRGVPVEPVGQHPVGEGVLDLADAASPRTSRTPRRGPGARPASSAAAWPSWRPCPPAAAPARGGRPRSAAAWQPCGSGGGRGVGCPPADAGPSDPPCAGSWGRTRAFSRTGTDAYQRTRVAMMPRYRGSSQDCRHSCMAVSRPARKARGPRPGPARRRRAVPARRGRPPVGGRGCRRHGSGRAVRPASPGPRRTRPGHRRPRGRRGEACFATAARRPWSRGPPPAWGRRAAHIAEEDRRTLCAQVGHDQGRPPLVLDSRRFAQDMGDLAGHRCRARAVEQLDHPVEVGLLAGRPQLDLDLAPDEGVCVGAGGRARHPVVGQLDQQLTA